MLVEVKIERQIVDAIRSTVMSGNTELPLHEPMIGEQEKSYVLKCLESGFVSSVGAYVPEFEGELCSYIKCQSATAVSSGTAALHICLLLSGVGQNDEVMTTPLSFVATSNAIAYQGAVPHFVDIDNDSFGMSPEALEVRLKCISERTSQGIRNKYTGRKISAVLPTHVFGLPCKIDQILDVSASFGIPVVEEAAESLGTR